MPLQRCEADDKPGWKWGDAGKCYVYTAGNEESEMAARKKAMAQAAAMGEFPGTGQNRSLIVPEVFLRARMEPMEDVSFKDRTIEVVVMPWGEMAETIWRGETWKETFLRGSLKETIESGVRIPVNRQHDKADTVGRMTKVIDTPRRAIGSIKVAMTPRGDDTLQLASEGMLGGSVGYWLKRLSDVLVDRRAMLRTVKRAFLDHFAMVDAPSYPGAETLAVHDDLTPHPQAGLQPLRTPGLDEWLSDETFAWAASRVADK